MPARHGAADPDYLAVATGTVDLAHIAAEPSVARTALDAMIGRRDAVAELTRPMVEVARAAGLGLASSLASRQSLLWSEVDRTIMRAESVAAWNRPILETARIAKLGLASASLASNGFVLRTELDGIVARCGAIAKLCRPIAETAHLTMMQAVPDFGIAAGLQLVTALHATSAIWKPAGIDWLMPRVGPEPIFDEDMLAADAIYEAGWVPHYTTPFAQVKLWLKDEEPDLSAQLDAYYRETWAEVAEAIRTRLAHSGADAETRAGMDEALRAHEQKLYRASCRTVFPEVERAARLGFYARLSVKRSIVSLAEFRERLDEMDAGDLFHMGRWAFRAYCALSDDAYARFDQGSNAANDTGAIPNRHAVVHGLSAAQGHQQSVNALLLADFCLAALDLVTALDRAA